MIKTLRRLGVALAIALALATGAYAQVSIPNTLVAGTTITASGLNTNFTQLGNHALDRLSGGNIAGNVTVDVGITIDGIDIGATVCTTCTLTVKDLVLASPATGLTIGGNVIINTTGKIPALTSTYFTSVAFDSANLTGTAAAINGSAITALNATNLASGTVATARLGSGTQNTTTFLRGDGTWTNPCLPSVTSQTGTYTAVLCDFVQANGTFTVTLPAASTATNKVNSIVDVKNIGTGTITVARAGTDTIDGATSYTLDVQYQSVTLVVNAAGTGWNIR